MLVGLRVVWGAGRLGGFGVCGGFSRLSWLCGWFAWLSCRGCLSWLSWFAWLGGFGGSSGLGRLGGLCGWLTWLLCRGCLGRLSRLFLGLRAEKRTQGQKGPNDYDTHTRHKSMQSRANASP
jgi:hypothetical protein